MADPAAQSSLVSSSSSSTSVTSSSASSTRGLVGGSMSCSAIQDLLFWRDVKKSAVAFGASLVLLLSLATLSAVTVVAHVALALLSVTISLRVYRAVVQALQKSDEGHPFRWVWGLWGPPGWVWGVWELGDSPSPRLGTVVSLG
uniref:Reticulon n=1 Tax=Geospiza parvula TaxID=87175 RepID=A0A8U8BLX0_GEOPR